MASATIWVSAEVKLWKPMLAAKPEPQDLDKVLASLRFPLLGSPKYDGIRVTTQKAQLLSRTLKPIRNLEMQKLWGKKELERLDGEVIVGPPTAEDCFNRSTSAVMSRSASADGAVFYVFDAYVSGDFEHRAKYARAACAGFKGQVVYVEHVLLKNLKELLAYETKMCKLGHEGIMLRDPEGVYKQGRSTLNEGGLIAVKRFVDAEAIVLATHEQMENTNEKKLNELGRMKRSTHKAGKVGKGTLGAFTVAMVGSFPTLKQAAAHLASAPKDARFFEIGSGKGLTDKLRAELWKRRGSLVGKIIKFRYQKIGTMIKPRQPIFLGWRDKIDL